MELVTGAMRSLLPKLGELLKKEYGLQKGVKKKIESLSRELRAIHAVLRKIGDVPPDQIDELVRLWVRDIREASYDMEDIVDAFLVRVDFPNQEPTDPYMLTRLLKKVGELFKRARLRRKISNLIQDISQKLEEVAARRGRYTLDNIVANPVPATAIDPRIFNLYKRATELVGIEGPRDELINKLSLGDDVDVSDVKMKVISIVGFGGLGKTSLAKAVYDHLKPRFQCGAFVPVGRNPDIKKVFRDILIDLDWKQYTNSKIMVLDEKQLMDELKKFVKEKRCFIFIDDIWDKESWKLIRCALHESNCGSRLVITTRIDDIAMYAGEAYKIQPLSPVNSRRLLCTRIVDGEGNFNNLSTEACERILKKCGGVPLAIITIASLLANKPGEDWSEVYNSIGFGNEDNDDVGNTRRILSFSYYDLPSHLKACLLYLSIFGEDYVLDKNTLIWKWIAEGFIPEEQAAGVGLFELGERYFNELINRSMIQPQETRNNRYIDACSVHDMVLDLIHSLSSNENFATVLNGDEVQKQLPGTTARRLSLRHVEEPNGDQLASITLEKVRSLTAVGCGFDILCPRLPALRVLCMTNCYVKKSDMLGHLGSLLYLRYLGLTYTSITELPREVGYLKFLQTLDLLGSSIVKLPEEVGLLTQLVCLRAEYDWVTTAVAPVGLIGKLTSLQELWVCCLTDAAATMQFVKELGLLTELRVLRIKIHITDESIQRVLLESLGHLHNIRELHIPGPHLDNGKGIDAGSISFRHLRLLSLDCIVFSGLPARIKLSLAPNLCSVYARVQHLKDQDMETLARLPELRCLELHSSDTKLIKIRADGVGYFQKLRTLIITGPSIWLGLQGSECNNSVSGRIASTMMPSLESLSFSVHVRSLKDATQLGFDKLLGLENLGRTSLWTVSAYINCRGARVSEVEEVETSLVQAAALHPKHPMLKTRREQEDGVLSPYQEVRTVYAMTGICVYRRC